MYDDKEQVNSDNDSEDSFDETFFIGLPELTPKQAKLAMSGAKKTQEQKLKIQQKKQRMRLDKL